MYARDTILTLKKPRSTPDTPFAYDRVRVIGASPVHYSGLESEWTSSNAQGVIIAPLTEFASTETKPYGWLLETYDVEFIPDTVVPKVQDIKVVDSAGGQAGPTPEETFAAVTGTQQRKVKPKVKPDPWEEPK